MQESIRICVILQASDPIERDVSARIILLPSSATDTDFTASRDTDIRFTELGEQCVDIAISVDSLLERQEQFSAVLVAVDPDAVVTVRSAPVFISDSNSK